MLRQLDTLVVDKTGTLTEGKPRLVSLVPLEQTAEVDLLRLAATLEKGSEHPLAAAITAGAESRGIPLAKAESFEYLTGQGITGRVEGRLVALCNRKLMENLKIDFQDIGTRAETMRREGQTVMFVAQSSGTDEDGVAHPITADEVWDFCANGFAAS